MNTDFKLIREKFKKFKGDEEYFQDGLAILLNGYDLLEKVSNIQKKNLGLQEIARNNFIVNVTSTIETYFKGVVINGRNFKQEGYENLLKEKITLNEAYDLFKRVNVTRQYIVSHFYSFQNLESIEKVFSNLTGKRFLDEIEKVVINRNKKTALLKTHPNWRNTLTEIFTIRNRFIHEGLYDDVELVKIKEYFSITVSMIIATEEYLKKSKHLIYKYYK